jgi:hypothetical protein
MLPPSGCELALEQSHSHPKAAFFRYCSVPVVYDLFSDRAKHNYLQKTWCYIGHSYCYFVSMALWGNDSLLANPVMRTYFSALPVTRQKEGASQ